jgi:hypothetical protein
MKVIEVAAQSMNILDVTEDKIFKTLGKGKAPEYKPKKKTSQKKDVEPFDYSSVLK